MGLVYVGLGGPAGTSHIRLARAWGGREGSRPRAVASAMHLLRAGLAGPPAR